MKMDTLSTITWEGRWNIWANIIMHVHQKKMRRVQEFLQIPAGILKGIVVDPQSEVGVARLPCLI